MHCDEHRVQEALVGLVEGLFAALDWVEHPVSVPAERELRGDHHQQPQLGGQSAGLCAVLALALEVQVGLPEDEAGLRMIHT